MVYVYISGGCLALIGIVYIYYTFRKAPPLVEWLE